MTEFVGAQNLKASLPMSRQHKDQHRPGSEQRDVVLKKENQHLRSTNQKLKRENARLRREIDKLVAHVSAPDAFEETLAGESPQEMNACPSCGGVLKTVVLTQEKTLHACPACKWRKVETVCLAK